MYADTARRVSTHSKASTQTNMTSAHTAKRLPRRTKRVPIHSTACTSTHINACTHSMACTHPQPVLYPDTNRVPKHSKACTETARCVPRNRKHVPRHQAVNQHTTKRVPTHNKASTHTQQGVYSHTTRPVMGYLLVHLQTIGDCV